MKKLMYLALGAAVLGMSAMPLVAYADVAEVNEAVVMLTGAPTNGKRTTVDMTKRWGADVSVVDAATAKLQSAMSGASGDAARLLQEAVNFGKTRQHKETRLRAQGALYHMCQASPGGPGCDTVPKYGSYVP